MGFWRNTGEIPKPHAKAQRREGPDRLSHGRSATARRWRCGAWRNSPSQPGVSRRGRVGLRARRSVLDPEPSAIDQRKGLMAEFTVGVAAKGMETGEHFVDRTACGKAVDADDRRAADHDPLDIALFAQCRVLLGRPSSQRLGPDLFRRDDPAAQQAGAIRDEIMHCRVNLLNPAFMGLGEKNSYRPFTATTWPRCTPFCRPPSSAISCYG